MSKYLDGKVAQIRASEEGRMSNEEAKGIASECLIRGKVLPEAEQYGFWERAYSALEKQEKYAWHDLRKNPDDLPAADEDKLLVRDIYWHYKKEAYLPEYEFAMYFKGQWFVSGGNMKEKIIAWRYIEPFEEGAE